MPREFEKIANTLSPFFSDRRTFLIDTDGLDEARKIIVMTKGLFTSDNLPQTDGKGIDINLFIKGLL